MNAVITTNLVLSKANAYVEGQLRHGDRATSPSAPRTSRRSTRSRGPRRCRARTLRHPARVQHDRLEGDEPALQRARHADRQPGGSRAAPSTASSPQRRSRTPPTRRIHADGDISLAALSAPEIFALVGNKRHSAPSAIMGAGGPERRRGAREQHDLERRPRVCRRQHARRRLHRRRHAVAAARRRPRPLRGRKRLRVRRLTPRPAGCPSQDFSIGAWQQVDGGDVTVFAADTATITARPRCTRRSRRRTTQGTGTLHLGRNRSRRLQVHEQVGHADARVRRSGAGGGRCGRGDRRPGVRVDGHLSVGRPRATDYEDFETGRATWKRI